LDGHSVSLVDVKWVFLGMAEEDDVSILANMVGMAGFW
jgi:hypothetical protein